MAAVAQYAEIAEWAMDELDALGYHRAQDDRYAIGESEDRDLFRKAATMAAMQHEAANRDIDDEFVRRMADATGGAVRPTMASTGLLR